MYNVKGGAFDCPACCTVCIWSRVGERAKYDQLADMYECPDGNLRDHETVREARVCFGPLLPDVERRDSHARWAMFLVELIVTFVKKHWG